MRRSWLALLLALPAAAQLQLFTFDGTTERAVTPIVDLGATAMGDASEYRFHARNNTAAGIALQTIAIAGQAFSLSAKPALPYIVAPGNFAEFRVRFAPFDPGSYSATAAVNGSSILLRHRHGRAGGLGGIQRTRVHPGGRQRHRFRAHPQKHFGGAPGAGGQSE